MTALETQVQRYMNLPYRRVVFQEENADGRYWVAKLEGVSVAADGETPEEALHELEQFLPEFFRAALEDGAPIPEPQLEATLG